MTYEERLKAAEAHLEAFRADLKYALSAMHVEPRVGFDRYDSTAGVKHWMTCVVLWLVEDPGRPQTVFVNEEAFAQAVKERLPELLKRTLEIEEENVRKLKQETIASLRSQLDGITGKNS